MTPTPWEIRNKLSVILIIMKAMDSVTAVVKMTRRTAKRSIPWAFASVSHRRHRSRICALAP